MNFEEGDTQGGADTAYIVDERAAILEYCANFTRDEAERRALGQFLSKGREA